MLDAHVIKFVSDDKKMTDKLPTLMVLRDQPIDAGFVEAVEKKVAEYLTMKDWDFEDLLTHIREAGYTVLDPTYTGYYITSEDVNRYGKDFIRGLD